jgi:hypothetical protein
MSTLLFWMQVYQPSEVHAVAAANWSIEIYDMDRIAYFTLFTATFIRGSLFTVSHLYIAVLDFR